MPVKLIPSENSLDIHKISSLYESIGYPLEIEIPPMSFVGQRMLYGRVNTNDVAIVPRLDKMKQLDSDDGSVFALNFVIDAYKDLVIYLKSARAQRKFNIDGFYGDHIPMRSWEDLSSLYHDHMKDIYDLYVVYLDSSKLNKKTRSYDDFLRFFLSFANSDLEGFPVVRSSYAKSKYCSPHISGLIINTVTSDVSYDFFKVKEMVERKDFPFYQYAVQRFGFMIDKFAPWRLIADLLSRNMTEYIKAYGSGKINDVFQEYYAKVFKDDVFILQEYLKQFYDSYVVSRPPGACL